MNRMDRLFGLVLQLQVHGRRTARDLAGAFEVSQRTIYRDVQALCEAGVPVVAMQGQGYALTEGYFLPPLMFTGLEAGALSIGADYVARSLGAPFRAAAESAQAKLGNALTAESKRELREVQESVQIVQNETQPAHRSLRELRDAILGRRVLEITYHTYGRPAPRERLVEPYGLLHFGHAWQLLAYCRLRQSPRVFRLDRIDRVVLLDERFERSADMHVRTRPRESSEHVTSVVVRVRTTSVRWLLEERPYGLVSENIDADFTNLVFAVRDVDRLTRWLFRWADEIEVRSPESVRHRMRDIGMQVAQRHGTSAGNEVPMAQDLVLGVAPGR
jgi:predicted DNA-binding transcriptional regulator YafY